MARQLPEVPRLHPLKKCDEAEWAVWSVQFCDACTSGRVVETVCMDSDECREVSPALLAMPMSRRLTRLGHCKMGNMDGLTSGVKW